MAARGIEKGIKYVIEMCKKQLTNLINEFELKSRSLSVGFNLIPPFS